jgi:hypothetical protein
MALDTHAATPTTRAGQPGTYDRDGEDALRLQQYLGLSDRLANGLRIAPPVIGILIVLILVGWVTGLLPVTAAPLPR